MSATAETAKPRACPTWGSLTLSSVLDKWERNRPQQVFLRLPDGASLTYAQAAERVRRLSITLASHELKAGDTVLLRSGRRVEGLLLLLAAWRLGLNVCLAQEPLSARQITEGSVSFAPKMAVDAGALPHVETHDLRIMEAAASLFTIRLVGCFGEAPDGVVDLDLLHDDAGDDDFPDFDLDLEQDARLHTLRVGEDGKVEHFTRTQITLLSQALACAMHASLTPNCTLGTAFDPAGTYGLLATALPVLLVGATLELFDPLDASLDARLALWHADDEHHRLVLPAALAKQPGFRDACTKVPGSRVWITDATRANPVPLADALLVDCAGSALLPASAQNEGNVMLHPGAIIARPQIGEPLSFGTLRLEGGAKLNATSGSLMAGNIALASPIAAAKNGRPAELHITGQMAKLVEDGAGQPAYQLVGADSDIIRVGPHAVVLATINRALGLTGRWQDAAVFAVPDPLMGHRVEIAVQARASDDEVQKLPTLDLVRMMLRESGIGDAALPVKMHLVTRVPRKQRGVVDVKALPGYMIEDDGEPVSDMFASQAVA